MVSTSLLSGSGDNRVIRVWAWTLVEIPSAKAMIAMNETACFTGPPRSAGYSDLPLDANFSHIAAQRT
jgi:hypothetical protein